MTYTKQTIQKAINNKYSTVIVNNNKHTEKTNETLPSNFKIPYRVMQPDRTGWIAIYTNKIYIHSSVSTGKSHLGCAYFYHIVWR